MPLHRASTLSVKRDEDAVDAALCAEAGEAAPAPRRVGGEPEVPGPLLEGVAGLGGVGGCADESAVLVGEPHHEWEPVERLAGEPFQGAELGDGALDIVDGHSACRGSGGSRLGADHAGKGVSGTGFSVPGTGAL